MKIQETLSKNLRSWFSQLQPRSLTSWVDIKTAFLNKFLYDAAATRQRKFDDMMDKMIKGQEKELMSRFSQMLGIVYTEPNEESETMNTQIKKPDIEDIAESTLKSIDISSCDHSSDGDREITMEDFLELEEFLELEDGEKLGDLVSSREVTMEDFLELEEWLDSEQKLDVERNTTGKDLETSSRATINRHKPDEID
ncbi:hypothetical protein DY000_02014929 [Brassica cretica]|uniref:Retrotransposon gag domain-containing protein n=1 Tax=Brassica cretica TaxID=69181 RepID=A0ABQ7CUJ3_BRACR|nr:hypothetical protein DY000_02014929 [Brassica cretica]